MFDFKRTVELIKGAIFDPDRTWEGYKAEAGDWQKTAILLTGPLVVGSQVLAYLVGLISRSWWSPTLSSALMGIVVYAISAVIIAFVVAILSGLFKGRNSFPLALAATSLAFVPGYVSIVLMPLPWIGWPLGIALGIYGLVLLWRILPKYLDIPGSARVGHYILSLVGSLVAMFLVGSILGAGYLGRGGGLDFSDRGGWDSGDSDRRAGGLFGEMERQGRMMEAAENDTYDPPRNGKLSKGQVKTFIQVMGKTRDYRIEQTKDLEILSEKADSEQIESLSEVFSGVTGVMGLSTAEMEVVNTGGGNWAEHQWVKEQLRVARIQKDINDAVKHNYELYQKYEDELRELERY